VEIFSSAINQELTGHFEQVLERSDEIRLNDLLERSVFQRLRDASAALFSPYL
jgi:cardiolipin synthase